jgi:hypothetical protein
MLARQISLRKYDDRRVFADSMRVAANGDRSQFEKYIDSLKPEGLDERTKTETSGGMNIPQGFVVTEDF